MRGLARVVALGVLAVSASASAGCQKHLVGPKFDIKTYTPVAIVDFQAAVQGCDPDLGPKLADAILADVYQHKDYYRQEAPRQEIDVSWTPPSVEFVERARLAAVIKEQDFGATDRVDPSTAARIGSVAGAKAVLVGQVTGYGIKVNPPRATNLFTEKGQQHVASITGTISVSYRVVDSESAKILTVGNRRVDLSADDEFFPTAGEQPSLPNRDQIKADLIERVSRAVGQDFYYYFSY